MLSIMLTLAGCATRLSSWQQGSNTIFVGNDYEIQHSSVLFAIRGYIDSIRPTERTKDRLRSYADYDPYSMIPKADIPAGTLVKIHRIYKTRNGRIFITAIHNGEKVDITQLIRPIEDENRQGRT